MNKELLPQRKRNRLKGYDYSQNGAYFVTVCAKDRHELFGEIVGAGALIGPKIQLTPYGKDGPMRASAPTQSISQRVRSFKIMVTKELGFSVFQRSFYDHIIRNDAEYNRFGST